MRQIVKKLLPASAIVRLKRVLTTIQLFLMRMFAVNGFMASLYYLVISRKFYRQHRAVMLGRLEHIKRLKLPLNSNPQLRRNIHRLEKGLIMQPRKAVFAEVYITETVDAYLQAVKTNCFCTDELRWARDVLSEYFAVVKDNAVIALARSKFNQSMAAGENVDVSAVPYQHQTLPDNPVSFAQLSTLFLRRRSVRWYQQKKVPSDIVQQAITAAVLAPSACNRQPFQFYVAYDATKAAELAACAMGTVGFAENIPSLIVVVGDLSAYEAERDRQLIYIDGSLAAMQLMLALETLGVQSCPINWPDEEQREKLLADKLELAYWQRPIMLLAIGYAAPDGGVPFSQKKPVNILIKEVS